MSKITPSSASQDQFQGKWKQHMGSAKVVWGKLTDDEILQSEGQAEKLVGLVQEKYGITREIANEQVADFMKTVKS